MKYWHVYYDGSQYKLRNSNAMEDFDLPNQIATFKVFDMAYDYVTKLNGTQHINQSYSRWTVNR
jgi:hypothetical protein